MAGVLLSLGFSHSVRAERERRSELILFLDSLSLYLSVGFDLSYAWPRSLSVLSAQWGGMFGLEDESVIGKIFIISDAYSGTLEGVWWRVLAEAYEEGTGLREPVLGFASALRDAEAASSERFLEGLSGRLNVVLLLFFLPPTLVLILLPLVFEFLNAF